MFLSIYHMTQYLYTEPVIMSHNALYLSPREISGRQFCRAHRLSVDPAPSSLSETYDAFGNKVTFFTVPEAHQSFEVTATSQVEIIPAPLPSLGETWEAARERIHDFRPQNGDAYAFAFESPMVSIESEVRAYASESFPSGQSLGAAVSDLTARIHRDFHYEKFATTISTPLSEVMRTRKGVCQDFAHLEIACLRSMGLAARYVSGYLLTSPPPGREKLKGADASHAWISVYSPGHEAGIAGWVDYDPTNNCIPTDQHITLAWGRDFGDVSPIKGVILGGGETVMKVSVDVENLNS